MPLLREMGLSSTQVVAVNALANATSALGALILARLFTRFNPFFLLMLFFLGATPTFLIASLAGNDYGSWLAIGFCLGVFMGGAQIALTAAVAVQYPPSIRGTGAGWAKGMGRIGSILCPVVIGMLIRDGWTISALFAIMAVTPLLSAGLCLALFALRGKSSKDVAAHGVAALDLAQETRS